MSAQEERLTAIATAIREKDGTTGLIPASDFAARILAIKTGSDFAVPLVVTADAGAVVTAVNGNTILTATADENDVAVFSLEKPGEWSIEASLDGRTLGPKTVQVTDQYEAEFSFVESRLPKGYAEVEYIQSDGTGQYINTGICPTPTFKTVMDVEPTAASTTTTGKYFMYSYHTVKVSSVMMYRYKYDMYWNSSGISASSQYATNSVSTSVSKDTQPRRMVLGLDNLNKIAFVDDETVTMSLVSDTVNGTYAVRLLGYLTTSTYALAAKLYSCQMYDNDVPVRDFVPCINPDGIAGLYDLVEGVFYPNAGAGALTAGPAV